MKIVFLSNHMKFSGGRMLMLMYADFLASRGHDVSILVKSLDGELSSSKARPVPDFSPAYIPPCDLIIATSPK